MKKTGTTKPRRRDAARHPEPGDIVRAREIAGLTQAAAAALLHTAGRVWRHWENGDRRMHPAFWELFEIKIGRR